MFSYEEQAGRQLYVGFRCSRCGCIQHELLKTVSKRSGDHYDHLHNLALPAGWNEVLAFGRILCPECSEAFDTFMRKK